MVEPSRYPNKLGQTFLPHNPEPSGITKVQCPVIFTTSINPVIVISMQKKNTNQLR